MRHPVKLGPDEPDGRDDGRSLYLEIAGATQLKVDGIVLRGMPEPDSKF
jgi:hypothetical protein